MNRNHLATETLTYSENGHTYDLVCAWHVEAGKQEPAVTLVLSRNGSRYPACADCAIEHGVDEPEPDDSGRRGTAAYENPAR